ncbi:uncharacterized protein LOC107417056 [Ziziphus jujuba]|uniref:Uncharacterized protein LOC107417056 n=1 Tax=Ziziphus jujuba TaxID=326968 RepID=A0A6P4A5Q0_ZIZJJ|nr:uncharacterized protein LOC107417056 [Ziziphus jujuba]
MKFVRLFFKAQHSSRLKNLLIISSSMCMLYFLVSTFNLQYSPSKLVHTHGSSREDHVHESISLQHIVFGIASNKKSWPKRKDYVRLWWKQPYMRGCVFLEQSLPPPEQQIADNDTSLPPLCISGNTSDFRYTYRGRGGLRSAIRVARVVSETVQLNHTNVRWYVFGDDDTVFFPENLVKTLSKYDHELWYYIGTNSEIYEQNRVFGFGMAFGGAGFAISSPLAKVLARIFDSCIERYPHLYGSDSRISSCLAELGVGLTHEPGFHQIDLHGDMFGLLASHPVTPLVSLHHFDHINPIFPNMSTAKALQHLFEAAEVDSQRILQQTICYDRWYSWTISVSWGYAVQIFGNHVLLPDILGVPETFQPWKKGVLLSGVYTFNTRKPHTDPCQRPAIFFFSNVTSGRDGIVTVYKKSFDNCTYDAASPKKLKEVRVLSQRLELDLNQLRAPRRHCCEVLPSSTGQVMDIAIRECKEEELIHMQH